ncbi:MAG: type IV pilus modification protein PilV [Pseudomonas oryzihabitans]
MLVRRSQSGFSMIEVLVSVVLICVGLLGVAALQSKAVPFTQDSVQRNAAIMLSNDLLELVRSHPDALDSYLKAPGSAFGTAPDSCLPTPTEASDQLACWATQASALLPGAADLLTSSFYVCRNATPGPTGAAASCTGGDYLEIQVAWSAPLDSCLDGTTSSGTTSTCTYRVRTRL